MGRVKTVNSSVFITFVIILLFLGIVIYNYDFEAVLDRETGIDGLSDYIHESDEIVVNAGSDEITSVYAYLTGQEVQIRFEYGQFFIGSLRESCTERGDWSDGVVVPSNEVSLNEQETEDFIAVFSEVKPEYYVDEDSNPDEPGLDNPAGCVIIRTQTKEYFLQIGNVHSQSEYRYLNVEGINRLYLVSNRMYSQLTDLAEM